MTFWRNEGRLTLDNKAGVGVGDKLAITWKGEEAKPICLALCQ